MLLAATGALSIATTLLFLGLNLVTTGLAAMSSGDMVSYLIGAAVGLVPTLIFNFMGILGACVTILGGMRLRQLRSPTLVYAGAAFAMIPCCSGICCVLGLATGGYAIFAMQDDAVRAAMAEG